MVEQMHAPARLVFLAVLYVVAAPLSLPAQTPQQSNEQRVRDYVAAFNKREIDSMLRMVSDDIQWLSVAGDKITVETQGKARLRESMAAYFKSIPTAKSELEWVRATASRVAVMERAAWQSTSGPKSQAGLAVYEFSGELISRVYYYPVER